MRADGNQLTEITSLIDAGVIRPVVDRVFPFDRPRRPWPTSKQDAQKARSSSHYGETQRGTSRARLNVSIVTVKPTLDYVFGIGKYLSG